MVNKGAAVVVVVVMAMVVGAVAPNSFGVLSAPMSRHTFPSFCQSGVTLGRTQTIGANSSRRQ